MRAVIRSRSCGVMDWLRSWEFRLWPIWGLRGPTGISRILGISRIFGTGGLDLETPATHAQEFLPPLLAQFGPIQREERPERVLDGTTERRDCALGFAMRATQRFRHYLVHDAKTVQVLGRELEGFGR